jgi:NAD(P)-dependent dehydrogenase (short-subunit alcohol dehydrogenase family)
VAHTDTDQCFVFITGTSTGIGWAAAIRLARGGMQVLAGVRNAGDADAIERAGIELAVDQPAAGRPRSGGIRAIRIDVADAESVAEAGEQVRDRVGQAGLFGLINNAGIAIPGPIEFVSQAHWRLQFEVNLFGAVAVTQEMLPLLRRRAARLGRDSARIVNIGSIAGEIAAPVFGVYSASKFALAAFNDALRLEVRGQGIGVSLVVPGAIDTEIWRKEKAGIDAINAQSPARAHYASLIDRVAGYVFRTAEKSLPADRVAAAIEQCLTASRAPIRRLVGWEAQVGSRAKRWINQRVFDWAISRTMGVPGWEDREQPPRPAADEANVATDPGIGSFYCHQTATDSSSPE